MSALARSAAILSSGTIASLSGFNAYTEIEVIQHGFVSYCNERSKAQSWQMAWYEFWVLS